MKAGYTAVLVLLAACAGGMGSSPRLSPAVVAADSAVRAAVAMERELDPARLPESAVAVAPFRVVSSDTSLAVLGFGLADILMTDLSRSRQLRVVDRLRIDALVRELGLVTSGAVDSTGAARFGKLVGARRIVVGALTADTRERVRLDGRVGNVATGSIVSTTGTETTLDALLDAEKALAFAVFDQLGVVLSPDERTLVEQRPTRHLAALLAYSRGVRAEAQLDYESARRSFREAVRLDPRFSAAETRNRGVEASAPATNQGDLQRAGALAIAGVNAPTLPQVATAADPAFRQQLLVTILIIVNFP